MTENTDDGKAEERTVEQMEADLAEARRLREEQEHRTAQREAVQREAEAMRDDILCSIEDFVEFVDRRLRETDRATPERRRLRINIERVTMGWMQDVVRQRRES